ncbi:NUDIX hydrolase [Streptomyces sp. NRRL B-24484]|uniref:NUDIX hydrolase n=1 Tax=Streptomyces sp. NRRL B-24484 TaxID=1463833 RepID=UPI000AC1B261|nr:NUDIX hydrolase [Streptomyces sp. NRRL B-24484]
MTDFDVLTDLALREGIEWIGIGVVVRDRSGRVLVIRRAPHDVPPGAWEYPGGGREEGESLPAGAARELAEETGLTDLPLEYARSVDFTTQSGLRARQFVFTTVVPDGTPIALSPDHDDHRWAAADRMPTIGGHQRRLLDRLAADPSGTAGVPTG